MKAQAFALCAAAALFATACGEATVGAAGEATAVTRAGEALTLTPRIDVRGIGDVFETLDLAHLDFDAELFVLPTDNRNSHPGAVAAIRVTVRNGEAQTESLDGDLVLEDAGRYRVLLRIDPSEDGISVNVDGHVVDAESVIRSKGIGEPAPIAADDDGESDESDDGEPAPTPAEPAPTPAEPAPTPAEPAPTPAEPAPTPADDPWGEAGDAYEPLPGADSDSPRSEPAPTPAEPAPTPARAKDGQPGIDPGVSLSAGAEVSVSSRASFEFYVGVVEIETDDTELVISWDVSTWLRDLLAEPLGIVSESGDAATTNGVPGAFHDIATTFHLIAQ